jgi:N-acetyl sugar amidotransferase
LTRICDQIRASGRGNEYDCVLGLSGGVDSSYLAIKVHELGLRQLVVHVDAGWNSELAVSNIEKVVKHCNYDLYTHVVNWEEMRDLHLAYLKAGIANQDAPQDHIFFASLYHFATKNGISYILSGGNLATEGIHPPHSWHHSAMDAVNLRGIHKKFGEKPLKTYKTISFFDSYFWYPLVKKMRTVRPLNYMRYVKSEALKELMETIDYKPYPRKHGESLFTKIFQNHYLPKKFGYDKRRPHLSSLIVSGQISREEALIELSKPLYDSRELDLDIDYFCKKLRISRSDYQCFIDQPNRHYTDYPNWDSRYSRLKKLQAFVEKFFGKRINIYS